MQWMCSKKNVEDNYLRLVGVGREVCTEFLLLASWQWRGSKILEGQPRKSIRQTALPRDFNARVVPHFNHWKMS